jgi:hypothetical protein
MGRSIRAVATLVLLVGPASTARGDGLGRAGYEALAAMGISLVIGGLALSLAIILGGLMLVRGRRSQSRSAGAWRGIGSLALVGVLLSVGVPILTAWFGLMTALVVGALALVLVAFLGGIGLVRQHRRPHGRIRAGETEPGEA